MNQVTYSSSLLYWNGWRYFYIGTDNYELIYY